MAVSRLDDSFLKAFEISSYFKNAKRGGQKSVYFVVRNGRKEVLKIFNAGRDQRFDREMKIYEKFKHLSGLPKIYECTDYEGEVLVFEEYIAGETLTDISATFKGDNKKIKDLLLAMLNTLYPIWQEDFVHRDLKPENIIIDNEGNPIILDFGIARDLADDTITATGIQPGSYRWCAPEQYFGQRDLISYRTDIFSIGVIGFYLYHQLLPFGEKIDEIANRYKSNDETFDKTDGCELNDFFSDILKFKASQRPRSVEDIINLLSK